MNYFFVFFYFDLGRRVHYTHSQTKFLIYILSIKNRFSESRDFGDRKLLVVDINIKSKLSYVIGFRKATPLNIVRMNASRQPIATRMT